MKIQKVDIPAAGTWSRDCELLCLQDSYKAFWIIYHKDEDDTYWRLRCKGVVTYKVVAEEFSTKGYLINIPVEGAFFEILDSPWISEFGPDESRILDKCKHYVLQFYDETIEIIARDFIFEKLEEKPIINC
jgi:hypothetical protein